MLLFVPSPVAVLIRTRNHNPRTNVANGEENPHRQLPFSSLQSIRTPAMGQTKNKRVWGQRKVSITDKLPTWICLYAHRTLLLTRLKNRQKIMKEGRDTRPARTATTSRKIESLIRKRR